MSSKQFGKNTTILWHDRKRFWGMPISFTRYYLVEKENSWVKLFSSIGFLSIQNEELMLYRINDISLKRSLTNRIFGVGTLILHCNINSQPHVILTRVKNPFAVRAMLAELVEIERAKKGYRIAEFAS